MLNEGPGFVKFEYSKMCKVSFYLNTTVCAAWTGPIAILHLRSCFLYPYNLVNKFFYKISTVKTETLGVKRIFDDRKLKNHIFVSFLLHRYNP